MPPDCLPLLKWCSWTLEIESPELLGDEYDIISDMKTISLKVSPEDYKAFRQAAEIKNRSIAGLIREAMSIYRKENFDQRSPVTEIPTLVGHKPLLEVSNREDIYEEIFEDQK